MSLFFIILQSFFKQHDEAEEESLNSTWLDLVFKSTPNNASKALYALIKHGNFLEQLKSICA
jgi:hypothetical protein